MDTNVACLWAKTGKDGATDWHPLLLHLLDVAACADAILAREPESTRQRMAEMLGLHWQEARSWFLLVIACHDLGKTCPGFQCKWENLTNLPQPRNPNIKINHAFVSQIALSELLPALGWPEELAALVGDAVGCHHGERAPAHVLERVMGDRRALGDEKWQEARHDVMVSLLKVFAPAAPPGVDTISGPDFILLAGLTSFADWIGSNEDWFSFGSPEDCDDLAAWFRSRRHQADRALTVIGWEGRTYVLFEKLAC